jgi:hypothetical protein
MYDMHKFTPDLKPFEDWRFGNCYAMALALADKTSWPIEVLIVDIPNPNGRKPLGVRSHIVHAYVVSPDGHAYDALGEIKSKDNNSYHQALKECFLEDTLREYSNAQHEFYDRPQFLSKLKELSGSFWENDKEHLSEYYEKAMEAL